MNKYAITPLERLQIGSALLEGLPYGAATTLASKNAVSYWFIYDCKRIVKEFIACKFSKKETENSFSIRDLCKNILSLYLNCHGSLGGISDCLSDLCNQSYGRSHISNLINELGSYVPSIEPLSCLEQSKDIKIGVLSDELYINGLPVLAVMDSSSNYILGILLADQCDSDSWGYVWLSLSDSDTHILKDIACDLGSGLQKSLKEHVSKANFHYDLFHYLRPIAQSIGSMTRKIERKWKFLEKKESQLLAHLSSTAYQVSRNLASESPDHQAQLEKLDAKSKTYQNHINQIYVELEELLDKETEIKQVFSAIQSCFQIVDEQGKLGTYKQAEENLLFFIEYGLSIDYEPTIKASNKLKSHYLAAIRYFKQLPAIQKQLEEKIQDEDIRAILLFIWQLDQRVRASKNTKSKNKCKRQIQQWKKLLIQDLGSELYNQFYQMVRDTMQAIIRSSSMMENVNGRIRVFAQAARGQINQNRLNLIRFFLNHKVLNRTQCEERKGYSAYQVFKNKKQDSRHWFDILWEDYVKDKI